MSQNYEHQETWDKYSNVPTQLLSYGYRTAVFRSFLSLRRLQDSWSCLFSFYDFCEVFRELELENGFTDIHAWR